MNEFETWLTDKIQEWEFDLIGSYTLPEMANEVDRPVPGNITKYEYPRRTIIGKPLPYNLETNTFPLMKLESKSTSIPIQGLAADIQVTRNAYKGNESEYGEEWEDAFNLGMSNFMMDLQDKAENPMSTPEGAKAGLWDNDQLVAQNSTMILDPNNFPVTPEDGAKFIALLDQMVTSVWIASKHKFKADTMIVPAELEGYFNRSIPQYGNMSGGSAVVYLASKGVNVLFSYNAKRYNGGQILVYEKKYVRYFMAEPVDIGRDDKLVVRSGNNLYFPITGRFSGVDFRQPLAGQYWNHVLQPVVTALTTKTGKNYTAKELKAIKAEAKQPVVTALTTKEQGA